MSSAALQSGLKSLANRADAIVVGIEVVGKAHIKTSDDMTHILDVISEMRQKVEDLLKLQDHVTKQYKNVDTIVHRSQPGEYEIHEYKAPATVVKITRKPAPVKVEAPAKEPAEEPVEETPAEEPAEEPVEEENDEEALLKEEEEELARLEEETLKKEEEEELARLEEEEALRKEEEELAKLEEEEALRKEEEELARLEAEEAELAKLEEEELAKKAEEEAAAKKEQEEKAKKSKFPPPKKVPGKSGGRQKVVFK